MHVLVTIASRHGATAGIGEAIAARLTRAGATVASRAPEEVTDLAGVDAVVLGSAVYAGRWLAPARELVERLRGPLSERPVWILSSGPLGDPPFPKEESVDSTAIAELLGARDHRVFAGQLDKGTLGLAERAIVRALKAPAGDFRDWADVEAWADDIATSLGIGHPEHVGTLPPAG